MGNPPERPATEAETIAHWSHFLSQQDSRADNRSFPFPGADRGRRREMGTAWRIVVWILFFSGSEQRSSQSTSVILPPPKIVPRWESCGYTALSASRLKQWDLGSWKAILKQNVWFSRTSCCCSRRRLWGVNEGDLNWSEWQRWQLLTGQASASASKSAEGVSPPRPWPPHCGAPVDSFQAQ